MRATFLPLMGAAVVAAVMVPGCDDAAEQAAAPEDLRAVVAPPSTRAFGLDASSSAAEFLMEAPLENIHGAAPGSMSGELYLDLSDLARSRGIVRIDLDRLEIFQRKRETTAEELGVEVKNATQNEHARTWLQISEDTPAEIRAANRHVQFRITRVSDLSQADVRAMTGAERTVTATVHGDLRLHSRTVEQSARLELTFAAEGEDIRSVRVRTLEPVAVSLSAHEVRPRSAFDRLAEATLASLGQKVAEAAPITFEFTARAGEAIEAMPETALEVSEAAEAATRAGVEPEGSPTAP